MGADVLITSLDNDRIKNYVRLKDKKYRDKTNTFLVEGMHLVLEAYKKGIIEELIMEQNEVLPLPVSNVVYVTNEILHKISSLDTPYPVMALCRKITPNDNLGNRVLLLDEIQDPGNLGTIIRSAKAFDIDTIVLSENSVDLYNPKVVRATQGMLFHINIVSFNLKDVIIKLKEAGIPIYGTRVEYGQDVRNFQAKDKEKFGLIMGNEGNGVRQEILELCDGYLFIEMNADVESLNVGVATSIILYELNRR